MGLPSVSLDQASEAYISLSITGTEAIAGIEAGQLSSDIILTHLSASLGCTLQDPNVWDEEPDSFSLTANCVVPTTQQGALFSGSLDLTPLTLLREGGSEI